MITPPWSRSYLSSTLFIISYRLALSRQGKRGWLACRSSGAGQFREMDVRALYGEHIGFSDQRTQLVGESPGTADVPFGCPATVCDQRLQGAGKRSAAPSEQDAGVPTTTSAASPTFAASPSRHQPARVPSGCVPWPSIRSPTSSSPSTTAPFRVPGGAGGPHRQHDLEGHTAAAPFGGRCQLPHRHHPHPGRGQSTRSSRSSTWRRCWRRSSPMTCESVRGAGRGDPAPDAGDAGCSSSMTPARPATRCARPSPSSRLEVIECQDGLQAPQAAAQRVVRCGQEGDRRDHADDHGCRDAGDGWLSPDSRGAAIRACPISSSPSIPP